MMMSTPPPQSSSSSSSPSPQRNNGTPHRALPSTPPMTTTAATATTIAPMLSRWAVATGHAVAAWTAKTYALPDKTVASQVLMYRQLLHTPCKPGLKLSRPYQGTPAQVSVSHMPWWESIATTHVNEADGTVQTVVLGMKETGKMVISYDNLIARLWNKGTKQSDHSIVATTTANLPETDLLAFDTTNGATTESKTTAIDKTTVTESSTPPPLVSDASQPEETVPALPPDGQLPLPPIPHEYWVSQLGFQQKDPVTDFRSGGVLSLAMMVWIVESCPDVYARFDRSGTDPAAVLPFGITSINVTDMMAKFLMLSKNTDRMDALLSQKPFWSMFSDPYALLACQELALDMLADVVSELVAVRRAEQESVVVDTTSTSSATAALASHAQSDDASFVTVFDFTHILSVTETRVEHDLLGAGPVSVADLRRIHGRLQIKYMTQLQSKLERISAAARSKTGSVNATTPTKENGGVSAHETPVLSTPDAKVSHNHANSNSNESSNKSNPPLLHEQVLSHATGVGAAATEFLTHSVFGKLNPLGFGSKSRTDAVPSASVSAASSTSSSTAATTATPISEAIDFSAPSNDATDFHGKPDNASTSDVDAIVEDLFNVDFESGDWIGASSIDATSNNNDNPIDLFSIGGDDEDDDAKHIAPL